MQGEGFRHAEREREPTSVPGLGLARLHCVFGRLLFALVSVLLAVLLVLVLVLLLVLLLPLLPSLLSAVTCLLTITRAS